MQRSEEEKCAIRFAHFFSTFNLATCVRPPTFLLSYPFAMARGLVRPCLAVAGLAAAAAAAAAPSPATVTVDASAVVSSVRPEYLSFNFDWHLSSEETPAWVNASVLALNLSDTRLLTLTAALSPAHLRVGGSEGDNVTYAVKGNECTPNATNFCLTMAKWDEIHAFAAQTGVTVAFGLNAMAGRVGAGHADLTQVASLFAYSSAKGYGATTTLAAFEYGNELEYKTNATAYSEDVVAVRALLNSAWPDPATRPLLVANDENPDPAYWATALLPIAGSSLNASTWHMYAGYGLDPTLPTKAWSPAFFNLVKTTSSPMIDAAKDFVKGGGEIWVGETAMAWHSGQNGTTNTYLSGPWYISQLGMLASTHTVQCRQTLVGGYYELVNKWDYSPNPDFWTALLWKKTMGTGVLAASSSSVDVVAFAHCSAAAGADATGSATGVTVAFINLSNSTAYQLALSGIPSPVPRHEYVLSPADGVETTRDVLLNGSPLTFADGTLSPTPPAVVTDPSVPLVLQPHTYGYVVFPDAPNPCAAPRRRV